jgi:hypothetical protein
MSSVIESVCEISELSFHILVVDHLRKHGSPDWLWWHTPSGERADPRLVAKFKAMGLRRGIPDLTLVGPDGVVRFMEFKRLNGSLSGDQERIMMWCIRYGISHSVARSFNEALSALQYWGVLP